MYRSPAERPRARLPLLDQVTIKTPCRESWDAMEGDDRVRFCARCSKDVYDLSAMTADEAETFLATHLDDDDPCVRLYRRPDGRVLTSECVQGARNRHVRKVAAGVTAGVCAAFATTLALANVHVPDGRNLPKARARIDVKRLAVANFDDAAFVPPPEDSLRGDAQGEISGFAMGGIGITERAPSPKHPNVTEVKATVSPGLPIDVVRRVVRLSYGRARACYENALGANPDLTGEVGVKLVIERDGSVVLSKDEGSTLPDLGTVLCIVRGFQSLSFPVPDPPGRVDVSYRVSLKPRP